MAGGFGLVVFVLVVLVIVLTWRSRSKPQGFWDMGGGMELQSLAESQSERQSRDVAGADAASCSPEALIQQTYERLSMIEQPPSLRGARTSKGRAGEQWFVSNENYKQLEVDPRDVLGRGSFGVVFKGLWQGRHVAVKQLTLTTVDLDTFKQVRLELIREAGFHAQLAHTNIVGLCGFVTSPHMCIVLEFMERGSLFDLMQPPGWGGHGPLVFAEQEEGVLLAAALDTARGMLYLHSLPTPIVHRDLKCLNILCSEQWCYKIADFGLSRVKALSSDGLTQAMTQCGTPKWTAPEVFRSSPYNEAVDSYAYAMCLYEMLAGEVPFSEYTQVEVGYMVSVEAKRPKGLSRVQLVRPAFEPFIELTRRCWCQEPKERLTFDEIERVLQEQEARLGPQAAAQRVPEFKEPA